MYTTINSREERDVLNRRASQKLRRHREGEREANILDLSARKLWR